MGIIRGKAAEMVSFVSSPLTWVKSLMFLEEENQLLREKNLAFSLQIESMLNLQKENEELLGMLDFKRQTKLLIKPARVVNKGIQPNLLSIVIDGGKEDGIITIFETLWVCGLLFSIIGIPFIVPLSIYLLLSWRMHRYGHY